MGHYFITDKNLKSELKTLTYKYNLYDFCFYSDNGVFSKDKIDFGSKLLLETFLNNYSSKNISILDVGCGYGYLGIVASRVLNGEVTFIDVNKRSLHLTKMNLKENNQVGNVIESNSYENVTSKYDVIITNPPIRAGKEVVLDILKNAKNYLNDNGELWYVIRKDHGAKSVEKILSSIYKLEIVEKSKGFYIFKGKIIDN